MSDHTPRVLVVDDEPQNVRVIDTLLRPLKYEVISAANGEEALREVAAAPPDLVLMDYKMPVMDGLETTRRLKVDPATRVIPVVMVTAYAERSYRIQALEAGADEFLTKPIDKLELRARVRTLLQVKAYQDHMLRDKELLAQQVEEKTAQLRGAFERLKNSSRETIVLLSRAAEYRDDDTGEHVRRMAHVAAAVARRMGFDDEACDTLLDAAPMHDVGKIGIPDRILLKPGKLSADEWVIMRQHTLFGARILEGSDADVISLGEVIARTHHERWNGSGYPHGLKGEAIPIEGRITAIADVYDALTSERPYKKAFSIERSLEIIREERGQHFDPDVVDAFLEIHDEVIATIAQFRDKSESLLWQFGRTDAY